MTGQQRPETGLPEQRSLNREHISVCVKSGKKERKNFMEKTLRIGSVGTSSIMREMQEGIRMTRGLEGRVIYSRNMDRAREFAASVHVPEYCDDYEAMLKREDVDVVYIASPNKFHAAQALQALEHGKHVIVEKPAATRAADLEAMEQAARANDVFFFEAITTLFMPDYLICKGLLPEWGKWRQADICFGRYSSKYDAYLRGENPNVFSPEMEAGALNDMGIYCVHVAVDLFGRPKHVSYEANLGPNGVDLSGTLLLEYPEITCRITTAKDQNLECGCLLEGERGWIHQQGMLNDFTGCLANVGGKNIPMGQPKAENRMVYELARFRDAIREHDTEFFAHMCGQSKMAAEILEKAHAQFTV